MTNIFVASEAERMRARLENRKLDCMSCIHWRLLDANWCSQRKHAPQVQPPICHKYEFNRLPPKPIITHE